MIAKSAVSLLLASSAGNVTSSTRASRKLRYAWAFPWAFARATEPPFDTGEPVIIALIQS